MAALATQERVYGHALSGQEQVILDGRSHEEYRGERVGGPGGPDVGALRYGRIPGAKHLYFEDMLQANNAFKPVDALRALVAARGATPEKDVIAYCRIGERSSHTWFVLTYLLGYPQVRNYDGSWTEWGNLVNAPIER